MKSVLIVIYITWVIHSFARYGIASGALAARKGKQKESIEVIRATLHEYTSSGRMNDVIAYLDDVEEAYGTLYIDDVIPSLYSYKAVALYNGLRVLEAEKMLRIAVEHHPKDTRSWINLGEMQVQTFQLDQSYLSFMSALSAGDMSALPRAVRTKGWAASWQDFESLTHSLEKEVSICLKSMQDCRVDSAGGLEYCDVAAQAHVLMNSLNPNAQAARLQVPTATVAPYWLHANGSQLPAPLHVDQQSKSRGKVESAPRRLKVGFMSADFGVHPVAQLVRGLFQMINTSRIEVYCFSLQSQVSWWGQNISETVEHFVWLQNMNTLDAAKEVARLGVEVLIDLNGHTMHSGLTIMTHRPAPLQMSFLGLPTTTSAPFIDYYIADSVAVPPEQRQQYSEQLVLMSDCYIANDYAQIQGDVLKFNGANRAPRSVLSRSAALDQATFLFATLSNSQKMDPDVFQVWMNILQRFAGSKMVITEHAGKDVYVPHLQARARGFGVATNRLVSLPQTPWIDHLYAKTAIDLVLDTIVKNGHTTGLDGIWAGIPTISLAGGEEAPKRAAESIAVTLDSTLGLAYSLKEYEDLAFALARRRRKSRISQSTKSQTEAATPNSAEPPKSTESSGTQPLSEKNINSDALRASTSERLRLWRKHIGAQRTVSNLFDMPLYEEQFTRLLQGTWELAHIAQNSQAFQPASATAVRGITTRLKKKKGFSVNNISYNTKGLFHIFTPVSDRYRLDHDNSSGGRKRLHDKGEVSPPTKNVRRWNRDAQNRILVAQTVESAGSLIAAAAALLDGKPPTAAAAPQGQGQRGSAVPSSKSKSTKRTGHGARSAPDQEPHHTRKSQPRAHDQGQNQDQDQDQDQDQGRSRRANQHYPPLPEYLFDGRLLMLNIGGLKPEEGWLTVNAQAQGNIAKAYSADIQRDMYDLHGLGNNSVSAIYTSHTLEHNSFGDHSLENTLAEWYRVLRPGGLLLVSVPNLETLARMYLDPLFDVSDQWMVTKMMYGAQSDEFDYHMVGFNFPILQHFLQAAGFCEIERVQSFNLFQDTSELVYKGYFVSLNVAAKVCPDGPSSTLGDSNKPDDGFSVDHQASPYTGP